MANNIPFNSQNNNNLTTLKSNVLKNFSPQNLRQKIPEYENEYYKIIIEYISLKIQEEERE